MIETKSREFKTNDGTVILSINQLDGMKSTLLFITLTAKFGPALATAKGKDKIALLADLSQNLTPEVFDQTLNKLLSAGCVARFPGRDEVDPEAKSHLGEIFRGQPFEIFKVLMFALEVNYGDFFNLTQAKEAAPAS
jgi:hypothetical protein